jgi:hypothetical protein
LLQAPDIKFLHSEKITNDATCGGRMNESAIIASGVKYAAFPAITSDQRTNGAEIYRKLHMANRNGETPLDEGTLKVHYTIGGNTYMASDKGSATPGNSGAVTGVNITSGTMTYNTGQLTLQFSSQADDVTCDYAQRCFSFSGNVATVALGEQVPYAFDSADTTAGVAVELGDLITSLSIVQNTSTSGGFSVDACSLKNTGAAYDEITFTFTSGTGFTAVGLHEGNLGNGTINGTFAPLNKRTSVPLLSVPPSAWSGVWAPGDVLKIGLIPAARGLWIKNIIPAGTGHTAINTLKTLWHVD